MKKVIRLTESELTDLIHRIILESERDLESEMGKDEMEEGFFGPSKKEKEEFKNDLINKMEDLLGNSDFTEDEMKNDIDDILERAKDYNYKGKVRIKMTSKGEPMFHYEPELTKMQKLATGTRSQTLGK